jgi:hypothetical protein
MFHSLYGLSIRSNRPLPGVPPCGLSDRFCVDLTLGHLPDFTNQSRIRIFPSDLRDEAQRPSLLVWRMADSGDFWMIYDDGTEFVVDRTATRVWARWPETYSLEDAATYLLGPVFGFLLRLRGILSLHASAVEIGGRGVAILGAAGAGKSTLAAGFAQCGIAVLSDDVTPLVRQDGAFVVQSGYPRLRLWSDSVCALYGAPDAMPLITSTWDKRHVDLNDHGYRFMDRPAPLAAIYLLSDRTDDPSAPLIEAMKPRDILMALVANTYANYLLDAPMRAREFSQLEYLASTIPVRRVTAHASLDGLRDLCRAIERDCSSLPGVAGAIHAEA